MTDVQMDDLVERVAIAMWNADAPERMKLEPEAVDSDLARKYWRLARAALSAMQPSPAEAARVLLADRFGGYGNRKAMNAMWEYVHKQHGRHMLPVSHYDGVLQAGLRAIAEGEGQ